MRLRAVFVIALLTIALYATGCGVQPGRKLLTYNSATSELPHPLTANRDGTYGLYPDDGLTPVEKVDIKHGQPLGFRRGTDGRVVAYAGDKEYSLTAVLATEYSWKFLGKEAQK